MKIFPRVWPECAVFFAATCLAALLAASCASPARVALPPEFSAPAVTRQPAAPAAPPLAPVLSAAQKEQEPPGLGPLFEQVKSRYAFYGGQLGQWRALDPGPEGAAACRARLEDILHSYEQLLLQGAVRYPDLERFVRVTNADMHFLAGRCNGLLRAGAEQAGERVEEKPRQEERAGLPAALLPPVGQQPAPESAGGDGFEGLAGKRPLAPAPSPTSTPAALAVEPFADQLPAGQKEQWEKAVDLLGTGRYEEAIQAFSLLRGTSYDALARERTIEAENLAAFEMRRAAAALFVQAGRAGNAERKRQLLLDSRRILLEILKKYPDVEMRDKVVQNLQTLETHLAASGSSGP